MSTRTYLNVDIKGVIPLRRFQRIQRLLLPYMDHVSVRIALNRVEDRINGEVVECASRDVMVIENGSLHIEDDALNVTVEEEPKRRFFAGRAFKGLKAMHLLLMEAQYQPCTLDTLRSTFPAWDFSPSTVQPTVARALRQKWVTVDGDAVKTTKKGIKVVTRWERSGYPCKKAPKGRVQPGAYTTKIATLDYNNDN